MDESGGGVGRRVFLERAAAAGALLVGISAARAHAPIPRRPLGRTGAEVTILGLGCACAGQSGAVSAAEAEAVYSAAIDAGINYIDAARVYGKAEETLGRVLAGRRREDLFVITKAAAGDYEGARRSFEQSLRLLRLDYVDCLYWHGIGGRDVDRCLDDGGPMRYILDQKAAGKTRFVGFTSHSDPTATARMLEHGVTDALMVVLNFVDRHLYDFESKLLPRARELGCGILAMKVFGGMRGDDFNRYNGPNTGPHVDAEHVPLALRYALSLPGVTSAILGMHTPEQVHRNVDAARAFTPLSDAEMATADRLGRQIAAGWNPRFGNTA